MLTSDSTRRTTLLQTRTPHDAGAADRRRRSRLLLLTTWFLLSLWPTVGSATELMDMEEIIDEARLTFARFTGHPSMTWFRERARNARAVFIAPRVSRASYLVGATWGTGVLLVWDPITGRWSEPAFYTLTGASFGLQIGALTSEIVALATDDQEAADMLDGAFTLGISGLIGIGRMGGGISGSLETTSGTGFVTVASASGLYAGVAVGGTLVLVRNGANELYYGQPVDLSDLKEGRVRQWYSERLMRAVTDTTAETREPSP